MVDQQPDDRTDEPAEVTVSEPPPDVAATGEAALGRRLLAEFIGTLLFVAVGAGTATVLGIGPLARIGPLDEFLEGAPPGQEEFIQVLLSNTLADILPVAFAFGTALAVLVYAFGGVSGAHFNPAITFGLAITRRFRWSEAPIYWIVQVAGGIAGAFVVAGIYGQTGAQAGGVDILFGATVVQEGIDQWQAILAEAFLAFILMTAIMAVAIDPRAPKGWSGLIIGLGFAAGILATAQATGGSGNFARSLGPFVASLAYDVGSIPWRDLIVYAVGPIVGAAAAALVYESAAGLERVAPVPSPGAATPQEAVPEEPAEGTEEKPPGE